MTPNENELRPEGCPDWTCVECGCQERFATRVNGSPMDGQDYDLVCPECGSDDIRESPIEALHEVISKKDARESELEQVLIVAKMVLETADIYFISSMPENMLDAITAIDNVLKRGKK